MQGEILGEKLIIPRLRVRKDWFQNLDPDPTDHTHPDLGINPDAQDGTLGEVLLQYYVGVMPGVHLTALTLAIVMPPGICRSQDPQACVLCR